MGTSEYDVLTETNCGTPAGALFRRYWQPAALAEEPQAGYPVPVRLLGEDLVLFPDDQARPALLAVHCPTGGPT